MADHKPAAHAPAHGAPSHGGHPVPPDHVPHVTPLWIYLATWGTLVVLTAITVGASYLNFGPANLIIALLIATIKAAVVAALFMHLLHDNKFHTLILLSGGLFLFIFIAFTMFDTEYRGRADAFEGERPMDITRPFEGTKSMSAMKLAMDKKTAAGGGHGAAATSAASVGGHHDMAAVPAHSGSAAASASAAPSDSAAASAAGSASAAASGSTAASASVAPSAAAASGSVPPPPSASIAAPPGAPSGASHPAGH